MGSDLIGTALKVVVVEAPVIFVLSRHMVCSAARTAWSASASACRKHPSEASVVARQRNAAACRGAMAITALRRASGAVRPTSRVGR